MSPSRDDQLSPPERDALAGEYVLGLLDEAEFAAAERRLDTDRDFAASVERWRLHFFALDATATPIAPRVDLWPRIEAGLAIGTVTIGMNLSLRMHTAAGATPIDHVFLAGLAEPRPDPSWLIELRN